MTGAASAHDPLGGRADITRVTAALHWRPTITVADGTARLPG
ncbi:hypothetical protein ABZ801_35235 [Actinomadura sp. NPDC047616]